MKAVESLVNFLKKCDDAYYNLSSPIISDTNYDLVRSLAFSFSPKHRYFKSVGATVKSGAKRETSLERIMPSLDKLTPSASLNWTKQTNVKTWYLSAKKDGISISITWENGQLLKATTRGNGSVGQDVTNHIKCVTSIPKTINIKERIIISGELICPKSVFEKNFSKRAGQKYSAARNFVGGLLNSLIDPKVKNALSHVKWYVFDAMVIGDADFFKTKTSMLSLLKNCGFDTVEDTFGKSLKVQDISESFIKKTISTLQKDGSDFECDGLVIEPNLLSKRSMLGDVEAYRPAWAKAIKLDVEDQKKLVGVIDHINWNMSIRKRYSPVIILKEPLMFNGTQVDRCSIYNAGTVIDKKLSVGDKIHMIRSGDVIPRYMGTYKSGKNQVKVPQKCFWCASPLKWTSTKTDIYCPNNKCSGLGYLRLQHFVSCLKIDGISSGIIDAIWDNKEISIRQLFELSVKNLINIEGIGKIKAKILVDGLKSYAKGVELPYLMYASGLFCDENTGLGTTRLKQITQVLAKNKLLWSNLNQKIAKNVMLKTTGIGDTIAQLFLDKLPEFITWYKAISNTVKIIKKESKIGILTGMSFAFTNFRDHNLMNLIEDNGGTVDGVKKTTTALFYVGNSTKLEKAAGFGIPCIEQKNAVKYIDNILKGK